MEGQMLALGQKVKDSITGFSGHITGRTEYLNGCDHYFVEGGAQPAGTSPDNEWIPGPRLCSCAEDVPLETEEPSWRFELNDEVGHVHTEFRGVITARSDWLERNPRYQVMAEKLQDGKPMKVWFDEADIVSREEPEEGPEKPPPGGPAPTPSSHDPA